MRLTTDFWVSALVRRVFSAGDFAAVLRRGSPEAGAVFVITRNRMGEVALYGPAPQTSYDSAKPEDRMFVLLLEGEQDAIDKRLERELRFDPDIWLVELETSTATGELIQLVA